MKASKYIMAVVVSVMLTGCGIYKKYEMPVENRYVNELAQAEQQT